MADVDEITLVNNEVVNQNAAAPGNDEPTNENTNQSNGQKSPTKSSCSSKFKLEGFNRVILVIVSASVVVTIAFLIDLGVNDHSIKVHGGVVSDLTRCSKAGSELLQRKNNPGSAMDATLVSALCLTLLRPDVVSLGGCAQLLVHDQNLLKSWVYDGQCSSGSGNFVSSDKAGLFVGVPGFLATLYSAHQKHGMLDWKLLVNMAVEIADENFKISTDMAKSSVAPDSKLSSLPDDLKQLYKQPVGSSIQPPAKVKSLLKTIADKGPDAFYKGVVAKEIVDLVSQHGGYLTENDLAKYKISESHPLVGNFQHQKIVTSATWGGAFLLSSLQTLDSTNMTFNYDLLIEIFKHVEYAAGRIGDSSQATETINQMLSRNFSEEVIEKIVAQKNAKLSDFKNFVSLSNAGDSGASSLVAIDTNNTMVSLAMTLTSPYGSGLATQRGVVLNNALSLFGSKQPGAGTKPACTLAPVVVYNPKRRCGPRMVLGVNHGRWGITGIVQWLVNAFVTSKSICKEKDCMTLSIPTSDARLHSALGGIKMKSNQQFEVLPEKDIPANVLIELSNSGRTVAPAHASGLQYINVLGKAQNALMGQADTRSDQKAVVF